MNGTLSHHPVVLRGASAVQASPGPVLLERAEQHFIPAVLEQLGDERGLTTIATSRASTRDQQGVLRLFQPVHHTFYVALLEIACDTWGQPRLDPQRIDSAGLVVRRLGNPSGAEGWRQAGKTVRGWVRFSSSADANIDPDPARRPASLSAGHPMIDLRLASLLGVTEALAERASPLFVAPPGVCEATGRTLLYGVVPLASSERSELPAPPVDYDANQLTEVRGHLPILFQQTTATLVLPFAAQGVTPGFADQEATNKPLANFMLVLRQTAIELNAFGTTPEATALFNELNTLQVELADGSKRGAAEFLRDATRVLIERAPGSSVDMPKNWPAIDQARASRVAALCLAALKVQQSAVTPFEGRFDALDRQYVARAFVRVKPDEPGCPMETVWSADSEPFKIAPWYETGKAPPVTIVLPDATDKDFLKKVKPNVAFVVPPKLFQCLQSRLPADWLKGTVSEDCGGGGITLSWICSFSLPIITLCAFIVLYIFLGLFDLIFHWLLWIKICIPFPGRVPRAGS